MIAPLASLLRALSFLSRMPAVPAAFAGGPHPLPADAGTFPVAGLAIGLAPALLLLILPALGLGTLASSTMAVALLVAITGALHEDGLGDTADGLFGHHGRDRALDIMKDSRVGTYGVLALVLALMLRIALLAQIQPGPAALALLAAAAGSRGGMAYLWSSLPSARPDGVADRLGRPTARQGLSGLAAGAVLATVFGGMAAGPWGVVLALGLGAGAFIWFSGMLARRLGGQTGDTLGACQQMLDIAILTGLALASGQG